MVLRRPYRHPVVDDCRGSYLRPLPMQSRQPIPALPEFPDGLGETAGKGLS